MKLPLWKILALFIAVSASVFGYMAWRAYSNLVTIHVRNMDVEKVVGKLRWQSWENIVVSEGMKGKLTLQMDKVPLEEALAIIAEQSNSRFGLYYPVYKSGNQLEQFIGLLKKPVTFNTNGTPETSTVWTNLTARGGGFGRGGGRGGFGGGFGGGPGGGGGMMEVMRGPTTRITIKVDRKDLETTLLGLARYNSSRIVPEDGLDGTIALDLKESTMDNAVSLVSKQLKRKWDKVYLLQSFEMPRMDMTQMNNTNGFPGRGGFGGGFGNRQISDEDRERERERREKLLEKEMATMSPEEKKQVEENRQRMQEMQNMTPEQRREQMTSAQSNPQMQNRMTQGMNRGLKNSTPEQRVERYQRFEQMRRFFEQRNNSQ